MTVCDKRNSLTRNIGYWLESVWDVLLAPWSFIRACYGRYTWIWLLMWAIALTILIAPSPFAHAQEAHPMTTHTVGMIIPWYVLLFGGTLLIFLIAKGIQAMTIQPVDPRQKILSELGRVSAPIEPGKAGKVVVYGETWDAISDNPLEMNQSVQVIGFSDANPRIIRVQAAPEPDSTP